MASTPATMSASRSSVRGTSIGGWAVTRKRAPLQTGDRHRDDRRVEATGQTRGGGVGVDRLAEEGAERSAVVALVVHHGDGPAARQPLQQLATALRPLRSEQGHAISRPALAHAAVDQRIVGRAIGDVADDARIFRITSDMTSRLERWPETKMAGAPDATTRFEMLGADDLHPPALRRDPVEQRELADVAAEVLPLVARELLPRLVRQIGKRDPQAQPGGAMRTGERPYRSPERAHAGRDPVHRERPRDGDEEVEPDRLQPPGERTLQGRWRQPTRMEMILPGARGGSPLGRASMCSMPEVTSPHTVY